MTDISVQKMIFGRNLKDAFFFPKPVPNCNSWERSYTALCASDSYVLFFSEAQRFFGVFEKNNVSAIGNVFMQYFFSSLGVAEIGRKKLKS